MVTNTHAPQQTCMHANIHVKHIILTVILYFNMRIFCKDMVNSLTNNHRLYFKRNLTDPHLKYQSNLYKQPLFNLFIANNIFIYIMAVVMSINLSITLK